MDIQNMQPDDEEQPQEEPQWQPQKRLDARPKNNVYAPGTGPGTGRTAIRTGTINRDGSVSPVSSTFGTATGPLSQRQPRYLTPRPTPVDAYAQRQSNVKLAKVNGTFDGIRAKFNAQNSGHVMDEQGNISPKNAAPGETKSLLFKARQPGGTAAETQFTSVPDGQGGSKMVKVPQKPPAAAPSAPATVPGSAPQTTPASTPSSVPRPPLASAANAPGAAKPLLTINIPSTAPMAAPKAPVVPGPTAAPGSAPAAAPPRAPLAAAANAAPPKPSLAVDLLKRPAQTGAPAAPAAPATPNTPAPSTPPAAPGRQPSTATFEGQSRDKFFADARQRQGRDNAYSKTPAASPSVAPSGTPAAAPSESSATFEGQTREAYFKDAANRQQTDNAYGKQDTPEEKEVFKKAEAQKQQQVPGATGTSKPGTPQLGSPPPPTPKRGRG